MRVIHSYLSGDALAGYEIGQWRGSRFRSEYRIAMAGHDLAGRRRTFRFARRMAEDLDRGGWYRERAMRQIAARG